MDVCWLMGLSGSGNLRMLVERQRCHGIAGCHSRGRGCGRGATPFRGYQGTSHPHRIRTPLASDTRGGKGGAERASGNAIPRLSGDITRSLVSAHPLTPRRRALGRTPAWQTAAACAGMLPRWLEGWNLRKRWLWRWRRAEHCLHSVAAEAADAVVECEFEEHNCLEGGGGGVDARDNRFMQFMYASSP